MQANNRQKQIKFNSMIPTYDSWKISLRRRVVNTGVPKQVYTFISFKCIEKQHSVFGMRNIIVAPATVTSPTSKATPTRPKYKSVEEYLEKNREGYSRDDAESVSSNDSGFSGSSNKSTTTAPVTTYKDFLNTYGKKKFKSVTPPTITTTNNKTNIINDNDLIINSNNNICINVSNEEFSKKNVRSEIYIEIQDNKVQRFNITQKPKVLTSSYNNINSSFKKPPSPSPPVPIVPTQEMNTIILPQSIPPPPPPPLPQSLPPKIINRPRLSSPEIKPPPKITPQSDPKSSLIDEIKQRIKPDSPAIFTTKKINQNEVKSEITKDFTRRTLPRNWGPKKKEDLNQNDPQVKKLVYGAYRDMLGAYNNKANNFISTLPRNMVAKDKGVAQQVDNITSQGCIGKLNGRINPKEKDVE